MIRSLLVLVFAATVVQAQPNDKAKKENLTQIVVIRTPNGWALHIHSDGSGHLQYGARFAHGWRIKAGTFDAKKVEKDLRAVAIAPDKRVGSRSHYVYHFEAERKSAENGPPANYSRDEKVIGPTFQRGIDAAEDRFKNDRRIELLKRYPPGLPKEKE